MNEVIKAKAIEFDKFSDGLARDMAKFLELADEVMREGKEFVRPLVFEEYKDTEEAAYIHLVFSNIFAMYVTASNLAKKLDNEFSYVWGDY